MSRNQSGVVIFLWLVCAQRVLGHSQSWLPSFKHAAPRCTIERVPFSAITQADFDAFFSEQSPVILEGTSQESISASTEKVCCISSAGKCDFTTTHASCLCSKQSRMQHVLLQEYGSTTVKLSSANTFSHGSTHIKLREYIDRFSSSAQDTTATRANESFYLFGPHAALSPRLSELVEKYSPPPFARSDLAFSFGIGAHASGIPFHVHGHGFSEVIHGSKVLLPDFVGSNMLWE